MHRRRKNQQADRQTHGCRAGSPEGPTLTPIGCGWLGYTERTAPGARRLASAAAITVGVLGLLLGSVRVVMTLVAIDRIDRMLG